MDFKLEIEQKVKKLKLYITEFLSNEGLYENFGVFAKDIKKINCCHFVCWAKICGVF